MSLSKDYSPKTQETREALLQWMGAGDNRQNSILRRVAILLLTDAVDSECQNVPEDSESPDFTFLWSALFASGQEMTTTFMSAVQKSGVDIEPELLACELKAIEIIESINANLKGFTFSDMWRSSPGDALSEVLRAIGHGVSFWDNHRPEDFGQDDSPKLGWFETCYDQGYMVCTKLATHFE